MKKIISSAVLLTVLVGAVTMIVGCGEKPTKESVWERTPHMRNEDPTKQEVARVAFGSDGFLYTVSIQNKGTMATPDYKENDPIKVGKYSINAANKIITVTHETTDAEIVKVKYTETKDKLTIVETSSAASFPIAVFKKNYNISAEDIKKAVKP